MTRLVVTPEANADASEILTYLDREAGARIAESYSRRFQQTLAGLVDLPRTGAPRPILGRNTRIAIVQPYLLIYDFSNDDDTLTLLRILHGRRNITRGLLGH
ncbi:MAG: type II toxin-antitoxin system RelE/ParE family toxin [Xanthobacteraceae bacterium]|jgi:plasmid stabilization system protein ParE